MSQEILAIKDCPMCYRKPTIYTVCKSGHYIVRCDHCGKQINRSTIYGAVAVWNNFVDNKEQELAKARAEELVQIKPVTQIIDEVREQICNDYCRYLHEGRAFLSVEDKAYLEENGSLPHCDECPLNRL